MKYNRIATTLAAVLLAALVLAGHGQATATGSGDATPCTSAAGDRMQSGECLPPGQSIASANGCYAVVYQTDGNLVLYRTGSTHALWASNTSGSSAGRAIMQTDGNLVVYDASGTAAWASNTSGNSGSWLSVQDDGNVVIYRTDGTAAWNTNSVQPPCTITPPSTSPRTGDANCDGTANPLDAALILQFGAGLVPSLPCQGNADVNGDGQVNSIDDALILQYAAGYTTSPGGPVVAPPQPTPTQPPPNNVFTLQCDVYAFDGFEVTSFGCYESNFASDRLDCDWTGRFFDCKLSAPGESAPLQCWPADASRLACGVDINQRPGAFMCSGYLPGPGFTLTCRVQ